MAEPSAPGATGTGAPRVWRAGDSPASPWNVANVLTIVRILLAPVFVVLLAADDGADGPLRYAAAALFIVAIATDGVDGHIARSRNLVTDLGKLLDPIADKVLTGAALVMLSVLGELPWWVTIVILVRELGITAYRFAVLRDRVVAASRGGKLKTVAQAVAISVALLPLWDVVGDGMHVVNTVLMSIAFVLTVLSGLDYMRQALRAERA
ncbi:CDP-diacylglycerol--glycerol-3-phosphate 3-phosphatidyltransferase [Clavibacter michiganensis]|uniref:CDP-diacylglycerol--glycerol-3-phosphate 3-phosphatidyltransferase n=1 Tax=Clavibacter michiganensis TaxID=28447 RepID=UPI000CE79B86|nr:CDP-diacylglycerol--glycerol-3-phosphate 3-phosphatidyltransferase [Clavibacter michiganensis]MDO4018738.1 CDP-diacylglycerol--glycerol-3-phosphate 3-phosphatidyltransferase [Clavibacter michiganensis]MDO4038531.1 CDP-diacylglycerol--glycerol-3-phosphate 3-phosphatidyltransferase [Clavibacter michiganensis]MDO4044979.1 CDP-diacylglycerol--glycerol-3-phosphate 3-phosphatidyltransferase [Clavibacter michiganensis]MDO4050931.1 CDP-diacylglycerol--glycerol-3-phosphate 3-phosphatidyltransferase [